MTPAAVGAPAPSHRRADGPAPSALILRAQGTNCEIELCRAFAMAGAEVRLEHLDAAIADPSMFAAADLIGLPGGFSYGDDIASGRVMAVRLRERVWPALRAAAASGTPMIGVCNGFQVLVQVGLLPGGAESGGGDRAPAPTVALVANRSGRFVDRWVGVRANPQSPCLWTRPLTEVDDPDLALLPIAHGEGRFIGRVPEAQVALRYTENPNGSEGDIAGVCDPTGRILGLMPHPERFLDWTRHPYWTRLDGSARQGQTPAARMFAAAVGAVRLTMNRSAGGHGALNQSGA